MEWIYAPWPWYIAGPLIGLTVPALYLAGNKSFGISSTLRHLCAACIPSKVPFFQYDWKKESWNLLFAAGIVIGAFIAATWFRLPDVEIQLNPELKQNLSANYEITNFTALLPVEVFGIQHLGELRTWIFSLFGGFLVGFGTRYAGGCTSGHAITGLSTLQWPSLVATITFMIAGIFASWLIVPFLLSL
ncbi:MAG: YeeE/YedE family protein [Cytophagaceae bacterium]|nr:YeeE/YedE family protein [Cytophagaceae bacterium]